MADTTPGLSPRYGTVVVAPFGARSVGRIGVDPEADTTDTTEIPVQPDRPTTTRPGAAVPGSGSPQPWPLIWLATTLLVLAALTVVVIVTDGGTSESPAHQAAGRSAPAPTPVTTTPSTPATPPTPATSATSSRPSDPPDATPPASCADLAAQDQALEAREHEVQQTHRHDHATRADLKRQLAAQQQTIAAQARSLGC